MRIKQLSVAAMAFGVFFSASPFAFAASSSVTTSSSLGFSVGSQGVTAATAGTALASVTIGSLGALRSGSNISDPTTASQLSQLMAGTGIVVAPGSVIVVTDGTNSVTIRVDDEGNIKIEAGDTTVS